MFWQTWVSLCAWLHNAKFIHEAFIVSRNRTTAKPFSSTLTSQSSANHRAQWWTRESDRTNKPDQVLVAICYGPLSFSPSPLEVVKILENDVKFFCNYRKCLYSNNCRNVLTSTKINRKKKSWLNVVLPYCIHAICDSLFFRSTCHRKDADCCQKGHYRSPGTSPLFVVEVQEAPVTFRPLKNFTACTNSLTLPSCVSKSLLHIWRLQLMQKCAPTASSSHFPLNIFSMWFPTILTEPIYEIPCLSSLLHPHCWSLSKQPSGETRGTARRRQS